MIERFPDLDALSQAAANRFVALSGEAIRARGRFLVAFTGGSTPKRMYELLAAAPYAAQVDWSRVHACWGDERCVPPDHPESNYRMTWESLLSRVPIPADNIIRMRGELPPPAAADEYEQQLRDLFGTDIPPRFDLILLGMGADGHIASLFPGADALWEHARWATANYVPKLNAWRVTLTLPVLNLGDTVTMLVCGPTKATALRDVLTGPLDGARLPAQLIRPASGHLHWMVDEAAAALLT